MGKYMQEAMDDVRRAMIDGYREAMTKSLKYQIMYLPPDGKEDGIERWCFGAIIDSETHAKSIEKQCAEQYKDFQYRVVPYNRENNLMWINSKRGQEMIKKYNRCHLN